MYATTKRFTALVMCPVVILALAAGCGSRLSTAPPSATAPQRTSSARIIHLPNPSGGAVARKSAAPGGPSGDMPSMIATPQQQLVFVAGASLPAMPGSAAAWTIAAGGKIDIGTVNRLASALGLTARPVEIPAEDGGGYRVGPNDGSAASLTVSGDTMQSWYYSTPQDPSQQMVCETAVSGDGMAPVTTAGGLVAPPPSDPRGCALPVRTPAASLPTNAEAMAKAAPIFAASGVDPAGMKINSYRDEWSVGVNGQLMLGGVEAPLASFSALFGDRGSLAEASGALATPKTAEAMPLVTLDQAIQRLNSGDAMWLGAIGPGAKGDPSVADLAGVTPAPLPIDSGITPPTLPALTLTVVGAKLGLMAVTDADGAAWLLPAFVLSTDDSSAVSVLAVQDSVLQMNDASTPTVTAPTGTPASPSSTPPLVEPMPRPTPAPPTGMNPAAPPNPNGPISSVPGAITPNDAAPVVGMRVGDAATWAKQRALLLRVSTLDGEPQIVTADYSPTRINVSVTKGIVSAIDFVG